MSRVRAPCRRTSGARGTLLVPQRRLLERVSAAGTDAAALPVYDSAWSTQRPSEPRSLEPERRATSFPPLNRMSVGMLRMPSWPASCWFSSVFTLPTCSCVRRWAASWSSTGDIARHGPHHSAQKSTSTGRSPRPVWVWKAAVSSFTGWPVTTSDLQRAQAGLSASRSAGTRTSVWQ